MGRPRLQGWRGAIAAMGFRPAGLFAGASMAAELLGGLSLALGLFTSVGAALIVAQSTVILFHVHWPRGFWNTDRGIEYPLQLAVVAVVLGLVGRGALSIDGALATPGMFAFGALPGLDRAILEIPPLALRIALLLGGAIARIADLADPAARRHAPAGLGTRIPARLALTAIRLNACDTAATRPTGIGLADVVRRLAGWW